MSNKQKDPQPEPIPDRIGLWLAIGAGVGILPGNVFHIMAMGITMGGPRFGFWCLVFAKD